MQLKKILELASCLNFILKKKKNLVISGSLRLKFLALLLLLKNLTILTQLFSLIVACFIQVDEEFKIEDRIQTDALAKAKMDTDWLAEKIHFITTHSLVSLLILCF